MVNNHDAFSYEKATQKTAFSYKNTPKKTTFSNWCNIQ